MEESKHEIKQELKPNFTPQQSKPAYFGNPFAADSNFGAQMQPSMLTTFLPPQTLSNLDKRELMANQLRSSKRKEIIDSKRKKLYTSKYEE
jgi:hypothetical protein